jgi:hypothetical protein
MVDRALSISARTHSRYACEGKHDGHPIEARFELL